MAWIYLTEDALKTRITGPELEAVRLLALAAGQPDPVPDIFAQITREVRGYVAGCKENRLGPPGTIPDECLRSALSFVVRELCGRFPGKVLLKEERETANQDAIRFMGRVAACDIALAQPPAGEESGEVVAGTGVQLVGSRPNYGSPGRMKGLL